MPPPARIEPPAPWTGSQEDKTMIDCVVTYHQNPITCGVAKFNHILAQRLNVPLLNLFDPALFNFKCPFLSIKCSEFPDHDLFRLHDLLRHFPPDAKIRLFLHGFNDTMTEFELVKRAEVVFCGNRDIYERLKGYPSSVPLVSLWSPGTLRSVNSNRAVGEIKVFSFGMAHKLRAQHYFKLKRLLDESGRSYTVFLSTALHEGTSFEEAFYISFEQLSLVFGEHLKFLGFLSDDAIIETLRQSNFFAAFFEQGARENNSSIITAMENGCVVITNTDSRSPSFLVHGENMFDIQMLDALPVGSNVLADIIEKARKSVSGLGWSDLVAAIIRDDWSQTR
jgi:glycosyltransferase involved in cell wall biosynthesis